MRKVLVLGLLFLGVAAVAPAGQHVAGGTAVLPLALHTMSAVSITGGHVLAPHGPSQVRSGAHAATPGMRPVVSRRAIGHPVLPQPLLPTGGVSIRNSSCAGGPSPNISSPVPGLGFDYTNFSAARPNWGACHPVTGVVLPFFGGAIYVPVPYYTDSASQEEAQDDSGNGQSDSNDASYAEDSSVQEASPNSSDADSSSEPVAEFVFVKRDGSTLFAVAYTLLRDKIQYVTSEGLRRSVALDSLDLEATQKSNEERGNTINLPGPPASTIVSAIPVAPLR